MQLFTTLPIIAVCIFGIVTGTPTASPTFGGNNSALPPKLRRGPTPDPFEVPDFSLPPPALETLPFRVQSEKQDDKPIIDIPFPQPRTVTSQTIEKAKLSEAKMVLTVMDVIEEE